VNENSEEGSSSGQIINKSVSKNKNWWIYMAD